MQQNGSGAICRAEVSVLGLTESCRILAQWRMVYRKGRYWDLYSYFIYDNNNLYNNLLIHIALFNI